MTGDYERAGDVDGEDFNAFQICLTGPMLPAEEACQPKDNNIDGYVDLLDFSPLQVEFKGSQ